MRELEGRNGESIYMVGLLIAYKLLIQVLYI